MLTLVYGSGYKLIQKLTLSSNTTPAMCTAADNTDDYTHVLAQPWLHKDATCFILPLVSVCRPADWSWVNHLVHGHDAVPLNYPWNLPNFPSKMAQRCVLRLRYAMQVVAQSFQKGSSTLWHCTFKVKTKKRGGGSSPVQKAYSTITSLTYPISVAIFQLATLIEKEQSSCNVRLLYQSISI